MIMNSWSDTDKRAESPQSAVQMPFLDYRNLLEGNRTPMERVCVEGIMHAG